VASEYRVAGSAFVTSFEVSSSVGGRVEYSASLQVTGAVTTGTF
jgi:predicted secreted protein